MGGTTNRTRSDAGITRAFTVAGFALIALCCAISVWPIAESGSIPAFQQDWAWPISRAGDLQWLHAFVGLWDERSLGQANALPWQTYAAVPAALFVLAFGPSAGLALWLFAVLMTAALGCAWMLREFGARGAAALVPAAMYAFSPVAFTRLAAGHVPYLVAYALLPFALGYAKRALERGDTRAAIAMGLLLGLAACQVQFLAIGWIAVAVLACVLNRSPGWTGRFAVALIVSLAVQLQWLLPLAVSSTAALYSGQPALISFEYNNSAVPASAAIALGYFPHYYERHALPATFWVLYAIVAGGLIAAFCANRRRAAIALTLTVLGFILVAGLYGPLSVPLQWAFSHAGWFAVFRDLHYFAVLTAIGAALALGLTLQTFPKAVWPALAMVLWVSVPAIGGAATRDLIVPRTELDDANADMRAVAARGPGRVLWLPAEEPLGRIGSATRGRDFTAYGPPGNPSVSDAFQNPQLAYALATLRAGRPDWNALRAMDVRYVVFRRYIAANRDENFGTGTSMAFRGRSDAEIGTLLRGEAALRAVQSTPLSDTYELAGANGLRYAARSQPGARLFSELQSGAVALAPQPAPLRLHVFDRTADARDDWVAGTFGWRKRPWLPDSIWPFVWTTSAQPLPLGIASGTGCVLAAALPHGAELHGPSATRAVRGTWQPYRLRDPSNLGWVLLPARGDVTALALQPCDRPSREDARSVLAFAAGYDRGWRVRRNGRWIPPVVANGWMMAWPNANESARLTYLPAYAQAAGVALTLIVLAITTAASKPRRV